MTLLKATTKPRIRQILRDSQPILLIVFMRFVILKQIGGSRDGGSNQAIRMFFVRGRQKAHA
jgi:hypothetical protein